MILRACGFLQKPSKQNAAPDCPGAASLLF